MRSRRAWLVALALAFAALQLHAAVTLRPLFLRDTTTSWLPQAESFVHCLGDGSLPLWDPYTGFGRPLLADPRAAVLYPFTWLNLLVGPAAYYALFAIGHVALGGIGAYRLARLFGLSRPAAVTTAGVWMAGGPVLSLVAMWSHLAGAAFVPWLVWAFARLVERPSARGALAAGGLLALQLCVGSPETTALAALGALMTLVAAPRLELRPRPRAHAAALVGAALLGFALAAPQWMPTLDVLRRSDRQHGATNDALVWSLHPAALMELVVPARWIEQSLTERGRRDIVGNREPFLRSIYLGAAAGVLVAAALCRRRREAMAPAAMLLAGTVLALGGFTPVYRAATAWLPVVSSFRYPVKALILAALGWSLLAGLGLDRLRDGGRRERIAAAGVAAAMAVALVAVALLLHGRIALPAALRPWIATPWPPAGVPLVVAVASLCAAGALALVRPGRAALVLAAAVCLDLTYRHWALNPTGDPIVWRARPESLAALDRTGLARTYVHEPGNVSDPYAVSRALTVARVPEGLSGPEGVMLGAQEALLPPLGARWRVFGSFDQDVVRFDPLPIVQLRADFMLASPREQLALLRAAGVRNVVSLFPRPLGIDGPPVAEFPGYFVEPVRIFRVDGARPRAFLADGVRVGDGARRLLDPSFAAESEVLLPAGSPRPSSGVSGAASVTRFTCNAVSVDVEASGPARVVVLDAWDPGWRARVDGRPVTVERANVAFRSVEVPAGRHVVEWSYVPRGLVPGLVIAGVALALAAALVRRERSGRAGASGPISRS